MEAFSRLEWKSSGIVIKEAGEGSEIVWEHVKGDLDIYITQDWHCVSLRTALEILNNEQGKLTKKARVTNSGRKVAPKVGTLQFSHASDAF